MKPDAFDRLFDEHAADLLAFLTYRTGDRAAAEDLLSDTFERVLRSRHRFDARKGSAKSWIYAIALNLVRDRARRGDAERRALQGAHERDTRAEHADMARRVLARQTVSEALEVLTPEEREAIALRYGGDLTVPEIAQLLGQPLTTVEGRVYRALRKLRAELGER